MKTNNSNPKVNGIQNKHSQKLNRWYSKQPSAVKAAIIGSLIAGIFGFMGAIVGGLFDLSGQMITLLPKRTVNSTMALLQTSESENTGTPVIEIIPSYTPLNKDLITVTSDHAGIIGCYETIFPEDFNPFQDKEMTRDKFDRILDNRGNHNLVNFETLDFTLTNSGFDGIVKLSNKIIVELINYESLLNPINVISASCGGTGQARDFPVVTFTSPEIDAEYVERVPEIDYFTLAPDEFEVFHVDFNAQKPGHYIFRVGFEYTIKGITQVIYTPVTYDLWTPEIINNWSYDYGEEKVTFIEDFANVFKDGQYVSPYWETQKALETTPILDQVKIPETISYVKDRNIWVQDLGSGQIQQITFDGFNSNPIWSPDGNFLLFERYPDEDYYYDFLHPLYYLEGKELLTMISQDINKRQSPNLIIYDMTTRKETLLYENACCSAWSPNDDKIAFISLKNGYHYLVISSYKSSNLEEIDEIPLVDLFNAESKILEPISLIAWSPEDILYFSLLIKNHEGITISTLWSYDIVRKLTERLIEPTPLEGYAPGIGGIGDPYIHSDGMLYASLFHNRWGEYNPVNSRILYDAGQWSWSILPIESGTMSQNGEYGASQYVYCVGWDGVTEYCEIESKIYNREQMKVILLLENIFNIAWKPY